jgi:hypothetical protein
LLFALALGSANSGHAASVAIVHSANASPSMVETIARLRGELTSIGLGTELVEEPVETALGQIAGARLERIGTARDVDAAIAVVSSGERDSVEVWAIDKATGRKVLRTVSFGASTETPPHTLALRALEVLRSSFLELELSMNGPKLDRATAPNAAEPTPERVAPAQHRERFGVEAGGALVVSTDNIGPALLPMLRLDLAAHPRLILQIQAAGFGTHPRVAGEGGSAQITQAYVLAGACYRFRLDERVRPFLSLSAGALRTAVDGDALAPNLSERPEQWSFLLDLGAGAAVRLHGGFFIAMAGHAQVAEPYPAIRFLDSVVASSGRPTLVLSLALGAWL